MGMITIELSGSFKPYQVQRFSAQERGHAAAVSAAIEFLAGNVLPTAIKNDSECQKDGVFPTKGFGGKEMPPLKGEPYRQP